MPVARLHAADPPPTLDTLAEQPALVTALGPADCAAMVLRCATVLVALAARLTETAKPAPTLQPPVDAKVAAPLLGLHPDTLRSLARKDPAYQALRFDNGTDKLLFDLAKVEAFRKRRTG